MEKIKRWLSVFTVAFCLSSCSAYRPEGVSLQYARSEVALQKVALEATTLGRDGKLNAQNGVAVFSNVVASNKLLAAAREALKAKQNDLAEALVRQASELNEQVAGQIREIRKSPAPPAPGTTPAP